ncbi:Sucrase/ferredoxin-like-domain-containing protein [Fennellomyces sp. T-0311]|nr:Sucrase/ferredoxin-like-domain-containing protein [Fennellomyces sp. T-0311]
MSYLLRRISSYIWTPAPEEEPVDIDQIPPSDCIVDGDCAACPAPCDDHRQYPSYLQFDNDSPLLGSMKPYGRQIMISTGQVDWPEKIEADEGTLAANLSRIIKKQYDQKEGRIFITNTSMLAQNSTIENAHDVIILPDNIIVSNVTPDRAQAFFDQFLNIPLPPILPLNKTNAGDMKITKNPYKSMILICSHKKRDKRCGITAPILGTEFDHVLREKDICEDDVAIFMVSHVGGHKFAGNVICYINEGRTGIWYGRVNTCHCRTIIEDTICEGKVIKELYRGAMSHSFGEIKSDRLRW